MVAVDQEEWGMLGSKALSRELKNKGQKLKFYVCSGFLGLKTSRFYLIPGLPGLKTSSCYMFSGLQGLKTSRFYGRRYAVSLDLSTETWID